MMKWLLIILACFGAYCAARLWCPSASNVVTTIAGHQITWLIVALVGLVYFGSKLKSK